MAKGFVIFSTKKDQHFFMVTNLFLDHLQPFLVLPFLDQVPNKGFTLLAAGLFEPDCKNLGSGFPS